MDVQSRLVPPGVDQKDGLRVIRCSNCGNVKESEVIPALGHDFCDWTVTAAEGCEEDGEMERSCSRCGLKETKAIPATGHLHTELRGAADASCTESGYTGDEYCLDCGKLLREGTPIPATGHTLTHTDAKEATERKDGNIEYWHCSVCDRYFSDEACENEISRSDTVIPRTGTVPEVIILNVSSAEMPTSHYNSNDSTLELTVSASPEGAYVPDLVWTSSNEKDRKSTRLNSSH